MSKLIHRVPAVLIAVLALGLMPLTVLAEAEFSGGPPDGHTGGPGEANCTACHAGFPLNSGDGQLEIIGAPRSYTPAATYSIAVRISDPSQMRWGFEITAVAENGDGIGSFTITDATNTQLSDNAPPNRDYVKHTSAGTFNGTADGPVMWTFDWTAPATDEGPATFYAAGNAANGNGNNGGDYIYTTSNEFRVPASGTTGLLLLLLMITVITVVTLRRNRARVTTL